MKKRLFFVIIVVIMLTSTFPTTVGQAYTPPNSTNTPYKPSLSEQEAFDLEKIIALEKQNTELKQYEEEYIPPTEESLRQTESMLNGFSCSSVTDVPVSECEALLEIFYKTNGPGWRASTNWHITTTVGNWHGVEVRDGHVTELWLSHNNLTGTLPSDISKLSKLNIIFMESNQLTGNIPIELFQLTELSDLYLDRNRLTGSIPPQVGNLTNLYSLRLNNNQLTGPIPDTIGNLSKLKHLMLSRNNLSGEIPYYELAGLTNLEILWISNNQLTGALPATIGSLTNLIQLDLSNNQLDGGVPDSIGNLTKLGALDLSGNRFRGYIPISIGALTKMVFMSLNKNQLSGEVPAGIGNLTRLYTLDLSENNITGMLPDSITNLVDLCREGEWSDFCFGDRKTDFGYNLLHWNQSDAVVAFLEEKDPDWRDTQGQDVVHSHQYGATPIAEYRQRYGLIVYRGTQPFDIRFLFRPMRNPSSPINKVHWLGLSYDLKAWDDKGDPLTQFNRPLMMMLRLNEMNLGLVPIDKVRLHYFDEGTGTWKDVLDTCTEGEYEYDSTLNTIFVPACHLTEFAWVSEDFILTFPMNFK